MRAFILLSVLCILNGCKKENPGPEYEMATVNLTSDLIIRGQESKPFPGSKVYFFDFNKYYVDGKPTKSLGGYDMGRKSITLGPGDYHPFDKMAVFDEQGKATLTDVPCGRHYLVFINVDRKDTTKEIGFKITPFIVNAPVMERGNTWFLEE